jgi:GT2 family glycosyltransferase
MHKKVSIVIVNYGNPKDTLDLLDSLVHVSYPRLEVIVIDNGAKSDRTDLYQARLKKVEVYNLPKNLGFAGGVNSGINKALGDYILLLNNDTVVEPGFIEPMVDVLDHYKEVGMVSPKILFFNPSNILQYAGAKSISTWFGRGKKIGFGKIDGPNYDESGETGLCNGACLMIRKEVVEDVGLLSEDYFMYYEEHDFCFRAKRYGWKCYYVARSRIYHKQSMSIGKDNPIKNYYLSRNRLLFMRRFSGGFSLLFFYAYYSLFQLPVSIAHHLTKGQLISAKYLVKGFIWNFKN